MQRVTRIREPLSDLASASLWVPKQGLAFGLLGLPDPLRAVARLARLLILDVYVHLRKRNPDSGAIKLKFDSPQKFLS